MIKRILITGGGTGGHVYPAVAIIEYLNEFYSNVKILFIGTKKGIENSTIPKMNVDFTTIQASGFLYTKSFIKKVLIYARFIFNLFIGFFKSLKIIKKFKPDFVLGMGGYVCAPVLLAAIFLNKKIGLHEQNLIPGRLNKFFARYAKYVFLSFTDTEKYFLKEVKNKTEKFIFSGNPVRKSIRNFRNLEKCHNKWQLEKDRFTIVSFGGSLGAERLNSSVLGLYDYFRNDSNIQILLISGVRFYEVLKKELLAIVRKDDKLIFRLLPYIKEMEYIYRIADLIISRAGATTISELIITGIPAILVPYPRAIENHQYYNAEYLVKNGKALIVLDEVLSSEILFKNITALFVNEKKKYNLMREKTLDFLKINAAEIISKTILGVI